MVSIEASVYDFESGGIYYDITSSTILTCEVTYKTYDSYSGIVSIPASVSYNGKTYSVTSIGERAFYYCSGLTSITIPDSVTSIEHYTFQDCSGLISVTIGNSVKSIDYGAFDGCSSLTSIEIPNSVISIVENPKEGT